MARTQCEKPQSSSPEDQTPRISYGLQYRPPSRDEHIHHAETELSLSRDYSVLEPEAAVESPPLPGPWVDQLHAFHRSPSHHGSVRHAFDLIRSTSYVLTVGQTLQHPDFPHLFPGSGNIFRPPQPVEHHTLCYPIPYSPPYPHPDHRAPASSFAARRQRSAIACKHCRKRKVCPWFLHDSKAVLTPHQIRCSGYDSSPEGRCWNCVRFNQHCLFQPVSSRAVFVSASAAYGASGTAPNASQDRNAEEGRHSWNKGRPTMLYGALGVPYEHSAQAVAPQNEIVNLNPPPPDDDPHSASSHTFQSFHQKSRPRHRLYYLQVEDSGTYSYAGPHDSIFESSVTSRTGRQRPLPQRTSSGEQKDNIPPPMSDTARSPRSRHNDGKTVLVDGPSSCSSCQGRQRFKMHAKHGRLNHYAKYIEHDSNMLSKLDSHFLVQ